MSALALVACLTVSATLDAPSLSPDLTLDAGVTTAEAPRALRRVGTESRYNIVLPILEGEALHFLLAAANNLLLREHFAQISWDSIKSHFDGRRPWELDVDYFIVNQFGHPYQGALAFTAARSSGLSFWWSAIYPFVSSLTWEMFFEIDAPSYNDQVTTPVGGVFLGEALHRLAVLLLTEGGGPRWARVLGAFILEPVGQLNRSMFDGAYGAHDIDESPPTFGMFGGGVNLGTAYRNPDTFEVVRQFSPLGNVQGRVTYGMPGNPNFVYRTPFSHFDLDFNVSFGGNPISSLFIRGLLAGWQFERGSTRGVQGFFGQYDFASASLLRSSTVGFGYGASLQVKMPRSLTLQLAAVVGVVPFGSAGSLGLEDVAGLRDYHMGVGWQAMAELRLIWADRAWLRVVARNWFVAGVFIAPTGWDNVTYVTGGPLVRIWGPIAVGGDMVVGIRQAQYPDTTYERAVAGITGRLTLNWVSAHNLGAVR